MGECDATGVKGVLVAAADLMELGWVQNKMALSITGESCVIWSLDAVCFCATGAIDRALFDKGFVPVEADRMRDKIYALLNQSIPDLPNLGKLDTEHGQRAVTFWNDRKGQTKEHVICTFRKVAEALR